MFRCAAVLPRRVWNYHRTFLSQAKCHSNESNVKYVMGMVAVGVGVLLYKVHRSTVGIYLKEVHCSEKVQKFSGKSVVITGAAGDIGSATAKAFAQEGASIMLVDLNTTAKRMQEICAELMALGAGEAEWIACDVTDVEQVKAMVECSVKRFGLIDFFFNNAGIQGALRPVHEQDDAAVTKLFDVNVYGMFLGIKYVSSAMIEAGKGGVIVNTASVAGLIGPPNMIAYAASKFAVVGMTKTAAKDVAKYGIRVCAIAPGLIEGRLWSTQVKGQVQCRKSITGDDRAVTDVELKDQESRMIDNVPMKRLGRLAEIASVVLFLCSEDASYLTGTVIPIEGGALR